MKHLLQLAGGQTWPNFIPLLGFKPEKVTFLTSADLKGHFKRAIDAIQKTASELEISLNVEIISTESAQPTVEECDQVLQGINSNPVNLINLTGGTKPMSIAAYRYAKKHRIPSFYLDTRRGENESFEDVGTDDSKISFPDLSSVISRIDVRCAMSAQGFPVPPSFTKPDQNEVEFSRFAAVLRQTPECDQSIAKAIAALRKRFFLNNRFLRKGKLRKTLKEVINTDERSSYFSLLEKAADLQILGREDSGNGFFLTVLDPCTAGTTELKSAALNNFKLLEGIWFELALYHFLKRDGNYTDIAWSVEGDEKGNSRGETDLVAFNSQTLNLHFISCKTTGPHGAALDHIQGLKKRAEKEGGKFAKAELWVFRPKSQNHRDDLQKLCTEQNVTFKVFTE